MRLARTKPHEAPRHLLEQKSDWDLKVFYAYAVQDSDDWYAFTFYDDDGTEVAWALLIPEPLYSDLICHTFIIDKAHRAPDQAIELLGMLRQLMLELARNLGFCSITASVPQGKGRKAEALIRSLAGAGCQAYLLETVVRESVGES